MASCCQAGAVRLRPDAEIADEIKRLEELKPKVRHFTAFNDDNHKAIEAQILVLQKRFMEKQVWDKYEDEKYNQLLDSALQACRWMRDVGEVEAPSEDWLPLATE